MSAAKSMCLARSICGFLFDAAYRGRRPVAAVSADEIAVERCVGFEHCQRSGRATHFANQVEERSFAECVNAPGEVNESRLRAAGDAHGGDGGGAHDAPP